MLNAELIEQLQGGPRLGREEYTSKYWRGLPEARRQQAALLEKLRQKGVVAMLEEVLECPIEPLRDLSEKYESKPLTPEKFKEALSQLSSMNKVEIYERGRRITERVFTPKSWIAKIPYPTLSKEGQWDTTLVINLIQNRRMTLMLSREELSYSPFVSVSYKQDGELVISGAETTFSGLVVINVPERKGILETALANACVNPISRHFVCI